MKLGRSASVGLCMLLFTGCSGQGTAVISTTPTVLTEPAVTLTEIPTAALPTAQPDVKAQLTNVLTAYTSQPILYFQPADISDSQTVAFAETQNKDGYSFDVWYVTSSEAMFLMNIQPNTFDETQDEPKIWTIGGDVIFKCEDGGDVTGSRSYSWHLKNGLPVSLGDIEYDQPFLGMELTYAGDGQFTAMCDAYDRYFTADVNGSGHTWKLYYLYWPDNGDNFQEYGGIEISREQLLEAGGAKTILDILNQSGYQPDSIYYRTNGIINLNFSDSSDDGAAYSNITLKYNFDTNSVTPIPLNKSYLTMAVDNSDNIPFSADTLGQFMYGGTYMPVYFPSIATYPAQFPPS